VDAVPMVMQCPWNGSWASASETHLGMVPAATSRHLPDAVPGRFYRELVDIGPESPMVGKSHEEPHP
jgi:hypothetical protein